MGRYDGLIIPRSYSEYINKTDAATLQQALQLSGVLSGAVAAGDNKAVTSNAVNGALANQGVKIKEYTNQTVADANNKFYDIGVSSDDELYNRKVIKVITTENNIISELTTRNSGRTTRIRFFNFNAEHTSANALNTITSFTVLYV